MSLGGFRMFVVYHQRLHPAMYQDLSDANLARLIFYKVNHAIPFDLGLDRKVSLVREYDLPSHDPWFQDAGFNEVSCLVHVRRNHLERSAGHVGQIQYDMVVSDAVMAHWEASIAAGVRIIADAHYGALRPEALDTDYLRDPPWHGFPMDFILQSLSDRFSITRQQLRARIDARTVEGVQIALCNSFLLRRDLHAELAGWIDDLAPRLDAYTRAHPDHVQHRGHLGGIIERAVALYFLMRLEPGEKIAPLGVTHAHIPDMHRTLFNQQ